MSVLLCSPLASRSSPKPVVLFCSRWNAKPVVCDPLDLRCLDLRCLESRCPSAEVVLNKTMRPEELLFIHKGQVAC